MKKFLLAAYMLSGCAMYASTQDQLHTANMATVSLSDDGKHENVSLAKPVIIPDEIQDTKLQGKVSSVLQNIASDKAKVLYTDQGRLKLIESLALEQKGSDEVQSVAFNFEDIDLQNVAQYMERVHNVKFITDDILDPNKTSQKLAGNKISFRTNTALSKEESWSLFITFLSMAGLDVVPMAHAGFYKIVPLPNALQEALPTYIGTSPSLLPDTDMMIRYVYFMQYADPVKIQALMSKFQGATGSLQVYKDLKALIFADKAYNIKSLMTIVKELDKPVSPQTLSVLKLKKANVEDVINLYNSLRPTGQQRAWAPDSKDPATEFFAQNIVVTGDKRTNTLIILGPKDAVARLEDFIIKHVDVSLDAARNPVYVHPLEYTNAADMQKTLSQLVVYGSSTSAGQYGGVRDGQKYLQPMSIVADPHSNSLIINAMPEDYAEVKKLIEQLDVPQKQVALEVLLVQVTGTKTKQLGSQLSGPNATNTFLKTVSAQTSGLPPFSGVVVTPAPNEQGIENSIKSNLSSLLLGAVNQTGSTLLTFGQPIWAIFKILKTIASTKILQNPFIVVSNNSKGFCKVGTSRRVVTGEAISNGSTSATGYQTAEANLSVTIVPQINEQNIINLAIAIDNNQFVNLNSPTDAVQDQKTITTMATLADGEVLVLGGIMADRSSSATNGVPLLSKIPLFGWLFKNKSNQQEKTMFMVFICPKILDNISSQADVQLYTRSKIEETQEYLRLMDEIDTIDSQQDPLDRAFFGARETRADDITTDRLLDRKEIISYHQAPAKVPVHEQKVIVSKYTKRAQHEHRRQKAERDHADILQKHHEQKAHDYKSNKRKHGQLDTSEKISVIDMNDEQEKATSIQMRPLKNIVQISSGV